MNDTETILLSYPNNIPSDVISPFLDECDELEASIESHETEPQTYAGIEEYLPTVIVLYIAKPFFDSFLKKAGEDAYGLFKKSALALLIRANKLKVKVLSSGQNKVDLNYQFSRAISVYSMDKNGVKIKFLIPAELTDSELNQVTESLIQSILENSIEIKTNNKILMNTALLTYSFESNTWVIYDSKKLDDNTQ